MNTTPQDTSNSRCQHVNFKVNAKVTRLTDTDGGPVTGFTTDITVNCMDCNMPFQWVGPDQGSSPNRPMVSFDRTELRAPIIPVEEL